MVLLHRSGLISLFKGMRRSLCQKMCHWIVLLIFCIFISGCVFNHAITNSPVTNLSRTPTDPFEVDISPQFQGVVLSGNATYAISVIPLNASYHKPVYLKITVPENVACRFSTATGINQLENPDQSCETVVDLPYSPVHLFISTMITHNGTLEFPQTGNYNLNLSASSDPNLLYPLNLTVTLKIVNVTGIRDSITISKLNLLKSTSCPTEMLFTPHKCFTVQQNFYVDIPQINNFQRSLYFGQNSIVLGEDNNGKWYVATLYNIWRNFHIIDSQDGKGRYENVTLPGTFTLTSIISDGKIIMNSSYNNNEIYSYTTQPFPSGYWPPNHPELVIAGAPYYGNSSFGDNTSGQIESFTQLNQDTWISSVSQSLSQGDDAGEHSYNLGFTIQNETNTTTFNFAQSPIPQYEGIYFVPNLTAI